MKNHSYHEILSYLKEFSGEKYKMLKKCNSDEERAYMEKGAEAGRIARSGFSELVNSMSEQFNLKPGKITQWQNSGTFVSYFWCQLKESEYADSNISLSLFAEKADGTYRFRVSVELAVENSSTEERDNYRRILEIPLKDNLVYISGGNNANEFKVLDERDNNQVRDANYKKVQVSQIIDESEWNSDIELINLILQGTNDLMSYYKYAMKGENTSKEPPKKSDEKPSLEVETQNEEGYSPGISMLEWLEILKDPEIIGPVWGGLLAAFYAAGGEASCRQLGEKYHRSATSISGNCTQLAKAIQKKTGCPVYVMNGTEKFWYILFVMCDAEQKEDGSTVWKLRPELYEALTQFDIMRYQWAVEEDQSVSVKDALPLVKSYIASRGFSYPEGLIENFYLSLKSKPFVILAGTSGTGKTRLVKLFAEAIGAEYILVSVRPDWSDGSDLFGHYDLNGKFIEGSVCECFEIAEANPQKPVFLCLDEMNLARVEYYLSDFLSVIESREKQEDGSITTVGVAQYEAGIPDNLYIVGTVNMDETTFPFSRKVLDRANTIEFNYVDLLPVFDNAFTPQEPLKLSNNFLRSEYLILARDCANESVYVNEICGELQAINEILRNANAHVGYRVRDEIVFYMLENLRDGGILKKEEAFDNEIMQKILPRLQGSSASVRDMLCELFRHCAVDHTQKTGDSDSEKMRKVLEDDSIVCRYRKSAEKLQMMVRRFEDDGFTSYWL